MKINRCEKEVNIKREYKEIRNRRMKEEITKNSNSYFINIT